MGESGAVLLQLGKWAYIRVVMQQRRQ